MTIHESYPDRRDGNTNDSREADSQESPVARAWDALEQIHDRIAEPTPEASEQEIAAHVGDYVADNLIHDADQAEAKDRDLAEKAMLLQDGSTEVLLQGGVEDDLSISLDENPVTRVAEAGHEELLEDAATDISREDIELGTHSAILLGRAKEHIDRKRLAVPPRHEQSYADAESDETHPAAEVISPEEMRTYLDRLDIEYRHRLAVLFASCLQNFGAPETAFILDNEELRNKTSYAMHELGVDQDVLGVGDYYETAYVPRDPKIAKRAMELAARATQVNVSFQVQVAEIARATGSLHLPGPVKEAHRIAEKMEKEYGDEQVEGKIDLDLLASLVKDAVRCRIVVSGDPIVFDQTVLAKIEESGLHIAEDALHHPLIKRGFRDRHTGEPLEIESGTSYRDTKVTVTVTVEVPTRDGGITLCEIAIVTPEMAAATVAEHPIYEITRSLEGDDRPSVIKLGDELLSIQEGFYSEISKQISERVSTT